MRRPLPACAPAADGLSEPCRAALPPYRSVPHSTVVAREPPAPDSLAYNATVFSGFRRFCKRILCRRRTVIGELAIRATHPRSRVRWVADIADSDRPIVSFAGVSLFCRITVILRRDIFATTSNHGPAPPNCDILFTCHRPAARLGSHQPGARGRGGRRLLHSAGLYINRGHLTDS